MSSVTELLAAAPNRPACQRVREYHLTDRSTAPRPRDVQTAMELVGSALCARRSDPASESFVRYDGGTRRDEEVRRDGENRDDGDAWRCVEFDRIGGHRRAESLPAARVREWLRGARPELLAVADVPGVFDSRPGFGSSAGSERPVGREARRRVEDDDATTTRVVRRTDLLADPPLAAAFRAADRDERVFRLPLALAEETALVPVSGTDRLFVGEFVTDRGTARAHYVRQGRIAALVSKTAATAYELAAPDDADVADRGGRA